MKKLLVAGMALSLTACVFGGATAESQTTGPDSGLDSMGAGATYPTSAISTFEYAPWGYDGQAQSLSTPGEAWADSIDNSPREFYSPASCEVAFQLPDLVFAEDADSSVGRVAQYWTDDDIDVAPNWSTARAFGSDDEAEAFFASIEGRFAECLAGYSYRESDYEWTADSISVRAVDMPGFADAVVVDERAIYELYEGDDYYWDGWFTYVAVSGNVIFLVAVLDDNGSVDEAGIEAAFGAFAEHLEASA